VDKTYTVTVTASAGTSSAAASVDVYVAHGPVSAAVVGGYTRSAPLDKPFVLDGSISYDADNQTSSTLTYKVVDLSISQLQYREDTLLNTMITILVDVVTLMKHFLTLYDMAVDMQHVVLL
jgi:REJ domain